MENQGWGAWKNATIQIEQLKEENQKLKEENQKLKKRIKQTIKFDKKQLNTQEINNIISLFTP